MGRFYSFRLFFQSMMTTAAIATAQKKIMTAVNTLDSFFYRLPHFRVLTMKRICFVDVEKTPRERFVNQGCFVYVLRFSTIAAPNADGETAIEVNHAEVFLSSVRGTFFRWLCGGFDSRFGHQAFDRRVEAWPQDFGVELQRLGPRDAHRSRRRR